MRIPEGAIEEIRAASDIIDVVSEYVQLRQRGGNYFGLCPFHTEKTPSFSVNPKLGIYKCFGCGVGGDVFDFVMAIERAEFVDAARILAERAGIAVGEDEEPAVASATEVIFHALRFAARFYHTELTSGQHGSRALSYLRERGLNPSVIRQFGLGYAPDAWDALTRAAGAEHISVQTLEQAGLVLPRRDGSGYYDRFRDRVVFPIISHVGKVLGFGGRLLAPANDQPKYINSPETTVYHKGRVLYGLFQAKQAIRRAGEVILVEGYTDVISMHQVGIERVVASSGTALTADQVRLLSRYAQRVVLLYDSDAAGDAAMLRGLEMLVESGLSPSAVALPEGEDPDSFARSAGGERFQAYLSDHRQGFVSFRYRLSERAGALKTPDGQAEAVGQVLDLIKLIDDPIARETHLQHASEVTGVPVTTLWRGLERRDRKVPTRHGWSASQEATRHTGSQASGSARGRHEREVDRTSAKPAASATETSLAAEEALLRLMLDHGPWMIEFVLGHMNLDEFSKGLPRRTVERILAAYEEGKFYARRLLGHGSDSDVRQYVSGLLTDRESPSVNWRAKKNIPVPVLNEDALDAAAGAMTQLKLLRVQAEIERLKRDTLRAQQEGSDVAVLQRERIVLHTLRKQIEAREFIKWPEPTGKAARS